MAQGGREAVAGGAPQAPRAAWSRREQTTRRRSTQRARQRSGVAGRTFASVGILVSIPTTVHTGSSLAFVVLYLHRPACSCMRGRCARRRSPARAATRGRAGHARARAAWSAFPPRKLRRNLHTCIPPEKMQRKTVFPPRSCYVRLFPPGRLRGASSREEAPLPEKSLTT